jgi:hypothetical protein
VNKPAQKDLLQSRDGDASLFFFRNRISFFQILFSTGGGPLVLFFVPVLDVGDAMKISGHVVSWEDFQEIDSSQSVRVDKSMTSGRSTPATKPSGSSRPMAGPDKGTPFNHHEIGD